MTAAVATVKGGLFDQYGTTLSSIDGRHSNRREIAQLLGTRAEMVTRALMTALNGVAPGANATKTISRIKADEDLSGKRTIETQTLINRNTVAGDVTQIVADILSYTTKTSFGASPVANKDGNPLGTR